MNIDIKAVACRQGEDNYDAEVNVTFTEYNFQNNKLETRREGRQVTVKRALGSEKEALAFAQIKVNDLIELIKNWTTFFPTAQP